jgi:hypothetical protein
MTAPANGFPTDPREAAARYLRYGMCPIPVPAGSKVPGYPGWPDLRLTPDTVDHYFPPGQPLNLGILNGAPSGNLLDVDLDCEAARLVAPHLLPHTPWVFGRKSSREAHWIYRTDRALDVAQEAYEDPFGQVLVEGRGSGGQTIFPPSTHPCGEGINWSGPLSGGPAEVELAVLLRLVREVAAAALLAQHWPSKGSRDKAALALSGGLTRAGWDEERVSRFVRAVAVAAGDEEARMRAGKAAPTARKQQDDKNTTGWPTLASLLGEFGREVVDLAREWLGLANAGEAEKRGGRLNQADKLVNLTADMELFHGPGGCESKGYVTLEVNGHRETWPVASNGFRHVLCKLYHDEHGKAPGGKAVQDALNVIAGMALHDGPEHEVAVRLAEQGGFIWLDLADPDWRVVRVGPDGWAVVDGAACPVRFVRRRGMLALPVPSPGGRVDELRPLVNVPDDDAWVLFVAWLVAALRAGRPFAVLALNGEQGSAKSTLCRMARGLLDPNTAALRRPPRDERDLMIAASNGWVVAYDNLSGIRAELSDALCCLATGGGFGTRELYTDDEEKLFAALRPVLLNGIEDVVSRPDLLDRCITLTLPVIPEEQRRDEDELWRLYEEVRPRVLGALLDAVGTALRNLPHTRLERKPRMADFALWVTAAEPALGWAPGTFLTAYAGNRGAAAAAALDNSILTPALQALAAQGPAWEGTARQLLEALEAHADEKLRRQRDWPTSPRKLAGDLRRLAPSLRTAGVDVTFAREAGGQRRRLISLERTCAPPSPPSPPSPAAANTPPDPGRCRDGEDRPGPADRPADRDGLAAVRDGGDGRDDALQARSNRPENPEEEMAEWTG